MVPRTSFQALNRTVGTWEGHISTSALSAVSRSWSVGSIFRFRSFFFFPGDRSLHGTKSVGCNPVRRQCISWSLAARNSINATNLLSRRVLQVWRLWYCEQCGNSGCKSGNMKRYWQTQSYRLKCIWDQKECLCDIDRQLSFTLNHLYLIDSNRRCSNFISSLPWLPILDILLQESSRRPHRQSVLLGRLQQCFIEPFWVAAWSAIPAFSLLYAPLFT